MELAPRLIAPENTPMELTLEYRQKAITRVTLWGVVVNLVLAAAKLVGGFFGHSQAAEAAHRSTLEGRHTSQVS